MVNFIKVNGRMIIWWDMEEWFIVMDLYMKVNGKIQNIMEKGFYIKMIQQ